MGTDPSAWTLVVIALPGVIALLARVMDGVWASRRDAEARRRSMFADAYAAAVAYAEFPYVVRRRRASAPEDERIRISTELRSIQERIAHHSAWLSTESQEVGEAYEELVNATRRIAGGAIQQAWKLEPITTDAGMNIGIEDIDLRALGAHRDAYLSAVRTHLSWWRRRLPGALAMKVGPRG